MGSDLVKVIERISIESTDSVLCALRKMDEIGMKLLIVRENKKFRSLLSIGDIQRAIIKGTELKSRTETILREQITVCYDTQPEAEIHETMIAHRAEFMPVLDSEGEIKRIIFWDEVIKEGQVSKSESLDLPVVIMAGGKGTRLKPLTNVIPKPLIPVGERPVIEHILDSFRKHGMKDFYLVVNYKASLIESYFAEQGIRDFKISIVREELEGGTAGSLFLMKNKISETFFLTNCDTILDQDLAEVYRFHRENKNEITIIGALRHYPIPYGILDFSEGGGFQGIREKPEITLAVNSGTYLLEPHLIEEVPERTFFHITELIESVKSRNGRIGVFPVSEKSWLDIGEWNELGKTQMFLSKRYKK